MFLKLYCKTKKENYKKSTLHLFLFFGVNFGLPVSGSESEPLCTGQCNGYWLLFMPPESRCCELADVRARLKQEEEERLALQAEERRRQEEAWHRHQQDRERRQGRQSHLEFPYPVRIWILIPKLDPTMFFSSTFRAKVCYF